MEGGEKGTALLQLGLLSHRLKRSELLLEEEPLEELSPGDDRTRLGETILVEGRGDSNDWGPKVLLIFPPQDKVSLLIFSEQLATEILRTGAITGCLGLLSQRLCAASIVVRCRFFRLRLLMAQEDLCAGLTLTTGAFSVNDS